MPNKVHDTSNAVRDRVYRLVGQYDLFADSDGTAYMTLPALIDGKDCAEVLVIRSSTGRSRLVAMYMDEYGSLVSSQGLKEGIDSLEAQARKTTVPVGLRTMPFEKGFALDLGDKQGTKVIVVPGSWAISNEIRPLFRRGAGALALPQPRPGGTLNELRQLLNVPDNDSWFLLLGWLVYALQPNGPYPILVLQGEHGSSKSTFARIVTALIDPNTAPLIGLPKSERDLMVLARSRHLPAFDNVSAINPDMKDGICRLATGAGHAARMLYSDSETIVWKACKPIIVNGIDNLLIADDLADRAIGITLPFIPEALRVREADLMREFERIRPEVLGALLDAAASSMLTAQPPAGIQLPRMADFAHFAASAMGAFGTSYEEFIEIYRANRSEAVARGLDVDPLAWAISSLLASSCRWQGTAADLLRTLRSQAVSQEALDALPQTFRALGSRLRRLSPALRSIGVDVTDLGRTNKGYQLRLDRVPPAADEQCERSEHSTLLNLEEERKRRERSGDSQRSRSTPSAPADEPAESEGDL